METEYIEKQVAIKELCETYEHEYPTASGAFDEYATRIVPNVLRNLQPADVRPVVRGRWEMDSDGIPHCTECGCVAPQRLFLQVQSLACTTQFIMSNYCPDCGSYNGADMMGESEGGKG